MLAKFVNEYKLKHPCVDCGNDDIRVLTFDHVTDDKEIDVSVAVHNGWSVKRLLTEIEKCNVRCCNCHTIVTHERRKKLTTNKHI